MGSGRDSDTHAAAAFGPPPGAQPGDAPPATRPPAYLPPAGTVSATIRARVPGAEQPLLMTSHKPGIVALRPLSAMDLLDGAVKHIRGNPGPVVGLSVLVLCAAVVLPVLLGAAAGAGTWWTQAGLVAVLTPGELTPLLVAVSVGFAALVLSGLLAASVGDAVLGRQPSARQVWLSARHRVPSVVGIDLLVGLIVGIPGVLLVLVVGAMASAGMRFAAVLPAVVLGGAAVVVWSAFVLSRTCAASPAAVLERLGPRAALRRAWRLSSGRSWLVLGRLLLLGFVTLVVFWVVQLPLLLLGSVLSALLDLTPTVDAFVSAVLLGLATVVSAGVVVPFAAGAVCLLYVDLRMRTEGLDIVLRRAVAGSGVGPTVGGRR